MGLIVWSMAPELAQENEAEEGLAYFKQALKLDPKNLVLCQCCIKLWYFLWTTPRQGGFQ